MKVVPVALALLALAGCGSERDSAATTAALSGGSLSVAEAISSELDGPLLVRGYLIERDGELRLCEAILESHPPQCGEPSLRVDGPAPATSEERVSVLGEVEDGSIAVSETAGE